MSDIYRKIGISPTAYKIEQIRSDGIIRHVAEAHQGYQDWLKAGNQPEIVAYVAPAPVKDDDPVLVANAKLQKISEVRMAFTGKVEKEYSAIDISLQNAKAIKAIAAGKVLPLSFLSMLNVIETDATSLETKVAEIKACTLLSQLEKIAP